MCLKHLLGQGDEVFGNETRSRPKEKIDRDHTADDPSLKEASKESTSESLKKTGTRDLKRASERRIEASCYTQRMIVNKINTRRTKNNYNTRN